MQDIDFLPADYVCVQTTRKNNNWLRGLFVAVLGLMVVGWVEQQKSIRELMTRRDQIQERAASVLSQMDSGDPLRLELKQAENHGRLMDGLRSHVPPTRWLMAIVSALPNETSILEIHTEVDDGNEVVLRQDPNGAAKPNSPAVVVDTIQCDLDRLAKLVPRRALVISVRGSATDDIEVSQFLTALRQAELFERVQLLFTDHHAQGNRTLRSFAIRLRTRSINSRSTPASPTQPVASSRPETAPQ